MFVMFTPQMIRELREALGDSAIQFARRFGVHRDTVYSWEEGSSHPRYTIQEKLNVLAKRVGLGVPA